MNNKTICNPVGIVSSAASYLKLYDERFSHLKELGYDTLDVSLSNMDSDFYKSSTEMEKYCTEIRYAAEKNGLVVSQVHGPWPTDETTKEGIERCWDCMHKAVYGCHLLGSEHLVIHPQMPFGWGGDTDPDYAEQLTVDLMTDLIPDCEKYNVIVCLENMPFRNQRISSMKYIVRAVEKVNSQYVGICLDTGHCNYLNEDITENVYLAKSYLKVLHIHDNRKHSDAHLLPLFGNINWEAFAKALADIDYRGALSLETGNMNISYIGKPVIEAYEKLTYEIINRIRQMVAEFKNT